MALGLITVLALLPAAFAQEPAGPELIDSLASEDPKIRSAALKVLVVKGGVETLIQAQGDSRVQVRLASVEGLKEIGARNPRVLPALAKVLEDPGEEVRSAALAALWWLGKPARPFLEEVQSLSAQVRLQAVTKVAASRPEHVKAALLVLLDDPDLAIRKAALSLLKSEGYLGNRFGYPECLLTEPELRPLILSEDAELRAIVISWKGRRSPEELKEALRAPNPKVRWVALHYASGVWISQAPKLIPHVTELLESGDPLERAKAADTIRALFEHAGTAPLGTHAEAALPTLIRSSRLDPGDKVRRAASEAVTAIAEDLRLSGVFLPLVLPRAFQPELLGLLLCLLAWFALARRFPRRLTGGQKLAFLLVASSVPAIGLGGFWLWFKSATGPWLPAFLPDAHASPMPPWAGVLVCTSLAAAWAMQRRKPPIPLPEEDPATPAPFPNPDDPAPDPTR